MRIYSWCMMENYGNYLLKIRLNILAKYDAKVFSSLCMIIVFFTILR